ncbi:MAG: hypothetical protein WDN69_19145 [Aliidongia sp.]
MLVFSTILDPGDLMDPAFLAAFLQDQALFADRGRVPADLRRRRRESRSRTDRRDVQPDHPFV